MHWPFGTRRKTLRQEETTGGIPEPQDPPSDKFAVRGLFPILVVFVVFLVAATGTFIFVQGHSFSLYDDAYIYMRYAANVLDGCGLRWNCGDAPVEGFSSPAYLALSILLRLATSDAEVASQFLGWLLVSAAITTAALAVRRLLEGTTPLVAWAAALSTATLMAWDDALTLNAVIGMDSSLGMLAGAGILMAALSPQQRFLRLALILAVVVRMEFAVFWLMLPLFPAARRWRYHWPLLVFAVVLTTARWLVFHDILPNTYWAKSGGLHGHVAMGLRYVVDAYGMVPLVLMVVLWWALRPSVNRGVPFFLLGTLLWTALVVRTGGDFYRYGRLLVPLVPALLALGLAAFVKVAERLALRFHVGVTKVGAGAVAILFAMGLGIHHHHRFVANHGFEEIERWGELGRWIAHNRPRASVALAPIGAIGYYAEKNRLIDILGLTNPEIARSGQSVPAERMTVHDLGHERFDVEWVLKNKPDLVVAGHARRREPYRDFRGITFSCWAEYQLLLTIQNRREPYQILNVRLSDGNFWLMLERLPPAAAPPS